MWAVTTGWLLRFEVFPGYFTRSLAGYRGLLDRGPMVQDTWMKILFRGDQIGYSHSSMETDEKDPAERYTVNNQSLLVLNIMGERQTVAITAQAALDDIQAQLEEADLARAAAEEGTAERGDSGKIPAEVTYE